MIIFLYGADTFRSRQKLKELKEKFIREIDKSSLNLETLDGAKLDLAEFERTITTMPFLAKKRFVVIEDLLSKNRSQKIGKEIAEILEKNKNNDVILIFWESQDFGLKRGAKSKSTKTGGSLFTLLAQEKYAYQFEPLDQTGVYRWAGEQIKNRGGKINANALRLLAEMIGNDLWQLNSEIEKLISYKKNAEITGDDVLLMVQSKLEEDIFKLTDALGQKQKALALKLIGDQLKSGTAPTELLAKISWQFKNLLMVKDFITNHGQGYDATRLAYQLGLHPFVVKKTASQVNNYTLDGLKSIYRQLLQIDYRLKTSQSSPELMFNLLVAKF